MQFGKIRHALPTDYGYALAGRNAIKRNYTPSVSAATDEGRFVAEFIEDKHE
jgi:hypothetical protein